MGNALSKKNVLISTAATFTCVTLYRIATRFFKQSRDGEFLEELERLGSVQIQHNLSVSPNKLRDILALLHKYSYEFTKEIKEYNQRERQSLLECLNFQDYILAVVNDSITTKEIEEQVKNLIFDKLIINQEVLNASISKYQKEAKREETRHLEYILRSRKLITIDKAKLILNDKSKLEAQINPKLLTPGRMRKECLEVLGNDWEEVIKEYLVEDMLYAKYGMCMKVIKANLCKLELIE